MSSQFVRNLRAPLAAVLTTAMLAVAPSPSSVAHATPPAPSQAGKLAAVPLISTDQLRAARSRSIVFGHQSVGANILDGVRTVYRVADMAPPATLQWANSLPSRGGWIADAAIGTNGDPSSKIAAFEARLTSTTGSPDFALMKLCYVDITTGTNVGAVFAKYRRAMSRLRAAHRGTVILHATVPLTTGSPADNVKRQQYNRLIRKTYKSSLIVDIARVESTAPSGKRIKALYRGKRYYAMYAGYTSDGGHLNEVGAPLVATALIKAMARK